MAVFKMPFMHYISKSIADNTYCRTRGQNVVKTKIVKNTSNTLEQQIQRQRVKTMTELCKAFDEAIHTGFPKCKKGLTEWNVFSSINMDTIQVDDKLAVTIDYERIQVSNGNRRVVEELTVVPDAENHTLTFTHGKEDYGYGAAPTDMLYAVILEKKKMRSKVFPLNARDDDSAVTITLPSGWDMASLEGYVFVLTENKKAASNSIHFPIN